MISEYVVNKRIEEILLVANVIKGITTTGKPYLGVTLQDKSGQIECRKWEVANEDYDNFQIGAFVKIKADVQPYKNALQLKIIEATHVAEEDIEPADYIQASPIPREELKVRLLAYVARIKDPDIAKLVNAIVTERLIPLAIYPAATKNHHEYASGLIHHTVGMLDAGAAICKVYPSLNQDVLLGGIILHDIGKIKELSGPIVPKYTTEGQLIGHISIMHAYVKEKCDSLHIDEEVSLVMQHIILSHHGKTEFGAPVTPRIKEAEVLYLLDNLDARINMIDKALSQIDPGEFTPKIFPLESRCFYKPKLK